MCVRVMKNSARKIRACDVKPFVPRLARATARPMMARLPRRPAAGSARTPRSRCTCDTPCRGRARLSGEHTSRARQRRAQRWRASRDAPRRGQRMRFGARVITPRAAALHSPLAPPRLPAVPMLDTGTTTGSSPTEASTVSPQTSKSGALAPLEYWHTPPRRAPGGGHSCRRCCHCLIRCALSQQERRH